MKPTQEQFEKCMKMECKIVNIKNLVTADGKHFHTGMDMAFEHKNNNYLVNIAGITDDSFVGSNILLNKRKIDGAMIFPINEVSNIKHVYCD